MSGTLVTYLGCRSGRVERGRRGEVATLGPIDWTLFHAVNAAVAGRDWLEDPVTTFAALAVPVYAAVTFALWFLARPYGDTRWKLASVSALTACATALVANQAIAHVWTRPRPYASHAYLTQLLATSSPDPSFPSDHAAAAFAIAFAVLAFSRWLGLGFLIAAALIGLSRIALGLHYPSDVLAGLLVGWAAAAVVVRVALPWIGRVVELVSRVSDPLLKPAWDRLERAALVERRS